MALPYSPRTSFDVIVDLNSSSVRNFEGTTYSGKHVKVIGRTATVDTGSTLIFNGCASVTMIGGYYRPTLRNRYGGISTTGGIGPGTLTFNGVGDVYLEGVVIDNASIFDDGGDAIYCTAKTALTTVTMQNCHFKNVRGVEATSTAHGDIFQAGSSNMGRNGPVRVYNCTFSGNYQGFFLDPQTGGGIVSAEFSRVNMKRTSQASPIPRLIFLFSAAADYDGSTGYPVSFSDVWLNGGTGQTVLDCIWPSNGAGSTNQFPTNKYWAARQSEVVGGVTRFYATYPNLNDTGKEITGKIYEGDPPDGDYAPEALVGLNYVEGTDLAQPTGPTGPPWDAVADGNMLLPQNWVKSGPGTATVNSNTGQIAITAAGTRTSMSQTLPTQVGASYRLTYHTNTADQIASPVGSGPASLSDYVADTLRSPAPGDQGFTFTATTATTYISFTRTSAASPQASSIILERMPAGAPLARRLDGLSQYFHLDVSAAGLRTSNYNFFIGGWIKWTYLSSGGVYILDFGDKAPSAGTGRCRIVYDPSQTKLFASISALDGSAYREKAHTIALARDVWYHVGVAVPATSADPVLYFNGVSVGTINSVSTNGTVPPSETAYNKLTLGARLGSLATNFNPARYADWVWCSNSVPSGAQIAALAAKQRPNAISGFAPTYWWAFNQTSTTEPSLGAAATLTAIGAPTTVLGPVADEVVAPVVRRPLDFFII